MACQFLWCSSGCNEERDAPTDGNSKNSNKMMVPAPSANSMLP